jgi:hypothetical protein
VESIPNSDKLIGVDSEISLTLLMVVAESVNNERQKQMSNRSAEESKRKSMSKSQAWSCQGAYGILRSNTDIPVEKFSVKTKTKIVSDFFEPTKYQKSRNFVGCEVLRN